MKTTVIFSAVTLASNAWAGSDLVTNGTIIQPTPPTPSGASAPVCPPEVTDSGGMCLTREQKEKVLEALRELEDVHTSKAEVEFPEPIIIIRDWEDRVYINGGEGKPVKAKLRIGKHVDRDLEMQLPIKVFYRDAPPPPWFRLRIRAQAGILAPQVVQSMRTGEDLKPFWDAGIGWDFVHVPGIELNLAAYTGIRSAGGGFGLDLTKNFGVYAGYSLAYDGLQHSLLAAGYFAFN